MKQLSALKKNSTLAILTFCLSLSFSVKAQREIENAKRYLLENAVQQKLSVSDIDEMVVTDAYLSPTTGLYHLYFNQTYQSIEVYNGLISVVLKENSVAYVTNRFVPNLTSGVNLNAVSLTPVQALQRAASEVNLVSAGPGQVIEVKNTKLPNGLLVKGTYLDDNLSNENVEVKLYWLPSESKDGKDAESKVTLTWNVRFLTKDNQNSWNIHVDAFSGAILQKKDAVIHCSFGPPHQHTEAGVCMMGMLPPTLTAQPLASNSYNVFDYPLESPIHGARSIVSNPYTKFVPSGTGPGATNGWHDDGTAGYTNTRGNNVWAQEDANNNNGTGASPTSATLEFDYPYTQAVNTAAANQNAAITNLFYWNNLIHDVLWKYGFDEPSGNFQKDNQGRGGLGNDFVYADAQDGGGTNNANFNPPVDGQNGRMQMYLWSNANGYQPDGDFDNGIIAHEYGHGWSTRLTGGPANSSCLDNVEQGGEGWSDYAALMLTTNWASLTPTLASANIPRGIGTYALGQPITGAGIRPYRYSYDMLNINNPVTYAKVGDAANFSEPHGIGSIWATMLWDMTWEIILQDNYIEPNIYTLPANVANMKGNIAAFKLVNEGLRLQACSPSFTDARDAILAADNTFFSGRYRCAIGKAFARRGLGLFASTGNSSNDRVVTEDFTPFPSSTSVTLNSPRTASPICSNNGFSYTATASGATSYSWTRPAVAGISNAAGGGNTATVNETLVNTTNAPISVKYFFTLSGDACAVAQPVTVIVNPMPTPTVAAYNICQNATVPSGEGLVAPPALSNFVTGTLTTSSPSYRRGTGNNTTVYTAATTSGTNVYYQAFTFVAPSSGNVTFEITEAALTGTYPYDTYITLYQNSFNAAGPATNFLRGDDDSGTLLYSSKLTHSLVQGTTYVMVVTTYTNTRTGTFKLQSDTPVFSGTNQWYANAAGGSALATGNVFNPVGVAGSGIPNTATPGTTTFYLANAAFPDCRVPVTFTVNSFAGGSLAGSTNVCSGNNSAQFLLSGHSGTVLKWQSSANSSFSSPVDITNNTTTLNVNNVSQTTYYRAVLQSGNCTSYSDAGSITVDAATVGGSITGGGAVCAGTNSTVLTLSGQVGAVQKWQSASDALFTNPADIVNATTSLTAANLAITTYYRAVVKSGVCNQLNSTAGSVTVDAATVGGSISGSTTVCAGTNSTVLTLSGQVGAVQKWQSASDALFTNPADIANATTSLTAANLAITTYYRAVVKSGACSQLNSTAGSVTVDAATVGGSITGGGAVCTGTNSTMLTLSGQVGAVQKWQSSLNANFNTVTDIANTTASLTAANLANTTYYRAVVKSGVCTQLNSIAGTVTVDAATVGGSISGSTTVCAGANSTVLTLSGQVGAVQKWQSASDALFSNPTDIVNATATFTAANLASTTYYRAVVKSGVCSQLNSTNANVTVNPLPTASISGTGPVCQNGNSPTITFTGAVGTAPYTFIYKVNNGSNQTVSTVGANTSVNLPHPTSAAGTFNYTLVSVSSANNCSQNQAGSAAVTVNPLPTVSVPTSSVCVGSTLTLSPSSGGSWISSDPAKATVTNTGLVTGLSAGGVNFTFTAAGCSAATGNITVKPTPSSALTADKADVCAGSEVTLDPHCSLPAATVNWNPGAPTVFPAESAVPLVYKARCVLDGCLGNESSVEVRSHLVLADLKELGTGLQPQAIAQTVKDNLAPSNVINASLFPRRWTVIANACAVSAESAVFKLSGPIQFSAIDNAPPYALFSNVEETYYSIDHPNYGNGITGFPNGTYTLTVELRSADGAGGPFPKNRVATGNLITARTIQFTVGNAAREGVAENFTQEFGELIEAENWVSLGKNPVKEEVVIHLNTAMTEDVILTMYNLQGSRFIERAIRPQSHLHTEVFSVNRIPVGMYLFQVRQGEKYKIFKVLKSE
ncbi:MAG: M36 family metallopeptidase [Spirosomataceae bacterium]